MLTKSYGRIFLKSVKFEESGDYESKLLSQSPNRDVTRNGCACAGGLTTLDESFLFSLETFFYLAKCKCGWIYGDVSLRERKTHERRNIRASTKTVFRFRDIYLNEKKKGHFAPHHISHVCVCVYYVPDRRMWDDDDGLRLPHWVKFIIQQMKLNDRIWGKLEQ